MKLSTKIILPILLIFTLLILLNGCILPTVPSPGYAPKDIIGKIETPKECCDTSKAHMPGWVPMVGATVILTDDSGKVTHTTTTGAEGKYQFTKVASGLYIITAICPLNAEYLIKDVADVADKVAGSAFDAGIADCKSTALALVVEYLLGIYDEDSECFGEGTEVYLQVQKVAAEYESLNLEGIDLAAIQAIEPEFDADLVGLVCFVLESCCAPPEPGFTPEPEDEGGAPPYDPGPGPGPSGVVLLRIEFDPQAMTICRGDTQNINSLKAFYSDGSEINLLGNPSLIVTSTNGHATFNKNNGEVTGVSVGSTTFTATFGGKSDTLNVTVTHPTAYAGGPYTGEACSGSTVTINLNGSGSTAGGAAIVTYDWDFGDGSTGTGATPSHDYAPGSYTATLTVTDSNGCTDTDTTNVTITELTGPTAKAGGPYEGSALVTVTITFAGSAIAGDAAIVTYDWDFGDGSTGTGATPSHDYAPGSYTATLTVTDENGCTGTDIATVTVHQKTTQSETFMIAFEDLPIENGNDWDYNDFVGEIYVTYHLWSPDKLEKIDFYSIIHKARSAGHSHEVHVIIDGYDDTDPDHTYSATNCTPTITNTNDFHLFDPTDGTVGTIYALNIDFGDKPVPFVNLAIDWTKIHGDNDLPFEFYLYDAESGGDSKIENGDIRKLVVPDTWTIPASAVAIWNVYANVDPGPDFTGEDGTWILAP